MPAFSTWKDCTQYCKAAVSSRLLHQIALGAAGQNVVSFIDIYGVDGFFLVKNTRKSLFFLYDLQLPTKV